jgi:hypothetical protein
MIEVDWRVAFIDYIQEHKLRRSKGYVLVGAICTSVDRCQAYS